MQTLTIDGDCLNIPGVEKVASGAARVKLSAHARRRMKKSLNIVRKLAKSDQVIYGVNTGFGKLAEVKISPENLKKLQTNLIRSHACGVGEPFSQSVVRAMLLLRANVLAKSHAGCRPELVDRVLSFLNMGIHPVIPSQGSVGASGDLAPLAHLALVLLGEGQAWYQNHLLPGDQALEKAGLQPITLQAKEGLALINGTQATCAVAALALAKASRLIDASDTLCAMTVDGLKGTDRAFEPSVHAIRPHPGQIESARRILKVLEGSEIRQSHRGCLKVQDAYSLRCAPQVHGAVRDACIHCKKTLEIEINSATDNPLVLPDGRVISGGNFHGAPIGLVLDYLCVGLTDLASISERRLARLVDAGCSNLPAFLSTNAGLHSGYMMMQVTAASLVSECKTLAHPASTDSIPTSAGQEDHVSMSTWAARKFARVTDNLEQVLAAEYLASTQAIEFHRPLRSSPAIEKAIRLLRKTVPRLEQDRPLAPEIQTAAGLLSKLGSISG